jgi:hypothetical protein
MIKFGCILVLLVLWFLAISTWTINNDNGKSFTAFVIKSIFFWIAIVIAYSLGSMH